MKESGPNRRDVLKGALLAAIGGFSASGVEAKEPLELVPSEVTSEKLLEEKKRATGAVIESFWYEDTVRNHVVHSFFNTEPGTEPTKSDIEKMLLPESLMYIPGESECASVNKHWKPLSELVSVIKPGSYGVFILGDTQRMYLLKKEGQKVRYIKAYPVSTSREEWSRKSDSAGTPLGLHRIESEKRGMLGEVVSAVNKHADQFVQIPVTETGKEVVKTFVRSLSSGTDAVAEIVTGTFLITSKETLPSRGIQIHGTNRTNRLGVPGSGGCIRVSNVDVYDLFQYIEVGTPVMIHATKSPTDIALETIDRDGNRGHKIPPAWKPSDGTEIPHWGPPIPSPRK